jgi:non-heme chloroperoxidase
MKRKLWIALVLLIAGGYSSFAQVRFNQPNHRMFYDVLSAGYVPKQVKLSNGVQLEYVEQGIAPGIPVVFLHGITDSWHSYELVLPYLPQAIHAFAVSVRGHGNSDRTLQEYTIAGMAADVSLLVKQLGLGPVVVAGHSMGGMVAQQFALDYPELTKALVIISSDAGFGTNPGMPEFSEEIYKLKDPIDRKFMDDFQRATLNKPINPSYLDTVVSESMKLTADVLHRVWKGMVNVDNTERLNTIKQPVLILWGNKDAFVFKGDQDNLLKHLPQAKFIMYENTGHALHWEEPKRFANDLVEFLKKSVGIALRM